MGRYADGADKQFLATAGELVNRQGGRKGSDPVAPSARRREIAEAARAARNKAEQLPAHDQRHPEHDALSSSMFNLLQRYPQDSADQKLLAAAGEMLNRQGARRGGQPLAAAQRREAVVEAANSVIALSDDLA